MKISELYNIFRKSAGVNTDSRTIKENQIFIALRGGNFDGNIYAKNAIEQKALCAIIDNPDFFINKEKTILVENSLRTLQKLANFHRKKLNIPIIGITGTNGKTTTKELVNKVLSEKYNTFATQGNFNNHIGVPLSLLQLTEQTQIGIIEMGANHIGEIYELCKIAEPDYGLITNIGKAHLEGFGSFEGIINTKRGLFRYIEETKGKGIFYNADDEIITEILPRTISAYSYGQTKGEITGKTIENSVTITIVWKENDEKNKIIKTQLFGEYNLFNILAAIRIGRFFNVDQQRINQAIAEYIPQNKRSQIVKGKHNTIILDAYNANPISMAKAISGLATIETELPLVAILGDMYELGKFAGNEHLNIIKLAQKYKNIQFIFIGENFYKYRNNKHLFFNSKDEFLNQIETTPILNSFVLVKGSRGMKLEEIAELL